MAGEPIQKVIYCTPTLQANGFSHHLLQGMGTRYSGLHEPRGDKPFWILAWVPRTHYLRELHSQSSALGLQGKALQQQQFQGSKSVQLKGHSGSCSSCCTNEMHKLGAKKKRFCTCIYINIRKYIYVYTLRCFLILTQYITDLFISPVAKHMQCVKV